MISRQGVLGVGWVTVVLLVVLFGVDHAYNHGKASAGIASLVQGLIPQSVTIGKP